MPRVVSVIVALALLGTACTGDGESSAPDPQEPEVPAISFDNQSFDSYTMTAPITGQTDCDDVTLEVNGTPVAEPVTVDGTTFRAEVTLPARMNEVIASCDDEASKPLSIRRRLRMAPVARISLKVNGSTVTLDGSKSAPAFDGAEIAKMEWSPGRWRVDRGRPTLDFARSTGPSLEVAAPAADGEYLVALKVTDAQGRTDTSTTSFEVVGGVAQKIDHQQRVPDWIDSSVIYAPIPALWGNGGPKTVAKRLKYLKELGVDSLWLWPPTTLRTLGEEYAIDDYFDVDPSWGPVGALKDMVDEAHKLGMYVLIDFVPNHMSAESPYFKDTVERGEESIYWDFFDRDETGTHTHYFDWEHLPNLNYENPDVRRMIMEASAYWVRDIGIDGFRVDVAWGVKKRRPDFWLEWRAEMKRIHPDLFLLAEASAVDPYYFANGFDVAYDWTKDLGHWAWQSSFEFPQEAGTLLTTAITNDGKGYAKDARIMRFLNNNDTGVRFVDKYGRKMTKVAATMQFTLPGVPAMFGGDEIGASYEPYSNLTPISWKDKHQLRPFYERLIELKKTLPTLQGYDMHLLEADVGSTLAYVRPGAGDGPPLLVVLNYGGKSRVKISGAGLSEVMSAGPSLHDLLSDKPVQWSGNASSITISLPAESSFVLAPGGE
jgi:cyclomaltodextrinase / maltogenic alpha-amylase / neopullulanase